MDGQLDQHIIPMLEAKLEKVHFIRVDADTPDRLIRKADDNSTDLTGIQADILTGMFRTQLPEVENTNFIVEYTALSDKDAPATVTQNEMMRRMKEMAAMQPGMNFYGNMPDMYSLVINTEQPAVRKVLANAENAIGSEITPLNMQIGEKNNEISTLRGEKTGKDDTARKELDVKIEALEKEVGDLRAKEEEIIKNYASTVPVVKQIIDLALLKGNMLKGEAMAAFLRRSVDLL